MMKLSVFILKLSIAIALCFNLIGCGLIPTRNITSHPDLNGNEGILITKIRTNIEKSEIRIYGKNGGWPWANLTNVKGPEDLRVIKIRSGEAGFRRIHRGNGFVTGPAIFFNIEPETITYVGDLVVEWTYEEGGIAAHIIYIDREDETVGEVRKKYPWIFNEYKYTKSVPLYEK